MLFIIVKKKIELFFFVVKKEYSILLKLNREIFPINSNTISLRYFSTKLKRKKQKNQNKQKIKKKKRIKLFRRIVEECRIKSKKKEQKRRNKKNKNEKSKFRHLKKVNESKLFTTTETST